jgi:hypothetical protein
MENKMPNTFIKWLENESNYYYKDKEMKKKTDKDNILTNEQKEHLLDLFNAGNQVFQDFNIRYISAWDLSNLEDKLNQMQDLFNISPTVSEHTDNDGDHYPNHWSDHVWSDDPKAWRPKND